MKLIILVLFLACLYISIVLAKKRTTVQALSAVIKKLSAPKSPAEANSNILALCIPDDNLDNKTPKQMIKELTTSSIIKYLMWAGVALAGVSFAMVLVTIFLLPAGLHSFMLSGAVITFCWSSVNTALSFKTHDRLSQIIVDYITIAEEPVFWRTDNPAEAREKFRPEAVFKMATKIYPL